MCILLFQIGDGKTHYIQKQLGPHCVVITINESFTPLSAILKLRSLVQDYNKNLACTIFFNFTVVPSQVKFQNKCICRLLLCGYF